MDHQTARAPGRQVGARTTLQDLVSDGAPAHAEAPGRPRAQPGPGGSPPPTISAGSSGRRGGDDSSTMCLRGRPTVPGQQGRKLARAWGLPLCPLRLVVFPVAFRTWLQRLGRASGRAWPAVLAWQLRGLELVGGREATVGSCLGTYRVITKYLPTQVLTWPASQPGPAGSSRSPGPGPQCARRRHFTASHWTFALPGLPVQTCFYGLTRYSSPQSRIQPSFFFFTHFPIPLLEN